MSDGMISMVYAAPHNDPLQILLILHHGGQQASKSPSENSKHVLHYPSAH